MCENVSIAEAEYQYLSKCREFKCTRWGINKLYNALVLNERETAAPTTPTEPFTTPR